MMDLNNPKNRVELQKLVDELQEKIDKIQEGYRETREIFEEINKTNKQLNKLNYKGGIIDGIRRYAWYKEGIQYVGTTGTTLKEAIAEVEKEFEDSTS